MTHNVNMAQTVGNNRGLCSRCQYFAARRFSNGDERYVCRAEDRQAPVTGIVTECTDYQGRGHSVYGQMAWSLNMDSETGEIVFRDSEHGQWRIERGPDNEFISVRRVKRQNLNMPVAMTSD